MSRVLHQYVPCALPAAVAGDAVILLVSLAAVAAAAPAPGPADAAAMAVAWALLGLLGLHLGDVYTPGVRGRAWVLRWLRGLAWAALLGAGLWLAAPGLRWGGGWLALALPISGAGVLAWHLGLQRLPGLRRLATPIERVVLIGPRAGFADVLDLVRQRPDLGVRIVGLVEDSAPAELADRVSAPHPDRVVVGAMAAGSRLPVAALMPLERAGVSIERHAPFYASLTGRWCAREDGQADPATFPRAGTALLGQAAGVVALLLAAPLLAAIAVAIKLDSRGPVFYRQERVGRGGARFQMVKFRSMRPDAERRSGPVWAQRADPRATRVGRLLRSARLDELPQLWNMARGEMALAGPRPERPAFVARLEAQIPHYQSRHQVRPGITGWAQVRHPYGETAADARTKLEYDLFYLEYYSLGLELLVLLQTVKTMLLGRGAR